MKGIILAGGNGSRLRPFTHFNSKHLMPVAEKPMLYYPLSVLMLCDISDVLIICKKRDYASYFELFGDGERLGMSISYAFQEKANGIADAFLIGAEFIGTEDVALILGDNIFVGASLSEKLGKIDFSKNQANIVAYETKYPEAFGVIELGQDDEILSIEEKPAKAKSNWIATGLYFYTCSVVEAAKELQKSPRGELEISDLNQQYLQNNQLRVTKLGRGFGWLDAGTFEDY